MALLGFSLMVGPTSCDPGSDPGSLGAGQPQGMGVCRATAQFETRGLQVLPLQMPTEPVVAPSFKA